MKLKAFLVSFLVLISIAAIAIFILSCDGVVTPQPGKSGLTGYVYYYVSQTPIYVNNSTVHIEGTKTFNTTTSSSGWYSRMDIDPSKYLVWADAQGISSNPQYITFTADQKIVKDIVVNQYYATATAQPLSQNQNRTIITNLQKTPVPTD